MNKKIKTVFSYLMIIIGAILASFSVACILPFRGTETGNDHHKRSGCHYPRYQGRAEQNLYHYQFFRGDRRGKQNAELQKVKEIISRNKGSFSTVSTIDEILR